MHLTNINSSFFDVLHLLSVLFCVSSLFCAADLILSYLAFVISASTQMTLTFRVTFCGKKKKKETKSPKHKLYYLM